MPGQNNVIINEMNIAVTASMVFLFIALIKGIGIDVLSFLSLNIINDNKQIMIMTNGSFPPPAKMKDRKINAYIGVVVFRLMTNDKPTQNMITGKIYIVEAFIQNQVSPIPILNRKNPEHANME